MKSAISCKNKLQFCIFLFFHACNNVSCFQFLMSEKKGRSLQKYFQYGGWQYFFPGVNMHIGIDPHPPPSLKQNLSTLFFEAFLVFLSDATPMTVSVKSLNQMTKIFTKRDLYIFSAIRKPTISIIRILHVAPTSGMLGDVLSYLCVFSNVFTFFPRNTSFID